MIRITIEKSTDRQIISVKAKGHSGYAKAGEDIICAAVSSLFFGAASSIQEMCSLENFYFVKEEVPEFFIKVPLCSWVSLDVKQMKSFFKEYIEMVKIDNLFDFSQFVEPNLKIQIILESLVISLKALESSLMGDYSKKQTYLRVHESTKLGGQ